MRYLLTIVVAMLIPTVAHSARLPNVSDYEPLRGYMKRAQESSISNANDPTRTRKASTNKKPWAGDSLVHMEDSVDPPDPYSNPLPFDFGPLPDPWVPPPFPDAWTPPLPIQSWEPGPLPAPWKPPDLLPPWKPPDTLGAWKPPDTLGAWELEPMADCPQVRTIPQGRVATPNVGVFGYITDNTNEWQIVNVVSPDGGMNVMSFNNSTFNFMARDDGRDSSYVVVSMMRVIRRYQTCERGLVYTIEDNTPSCVPIWEAAGGGYWGTWDGIKWSSVDSGGGTVAVSLTPTGAWAASFRPSHVRCTFTVENVGATASLIVDRDDNAYAWSNPYTSGVSLVLDFSACGLPDCGDIARVGLERRSGTGAVYITDLEFFDGGVWKSYFCESDL
jgi:hypothetical protein